MRETDNRDGFFWVHGNS